MTVDRPLCSKFYNDTQTYRWIRRAQTNKLTELQMLPSVFSFCYMVENNRIRHDKYGGNMKGFSQKQDTEVNLKIT